MLYSQQKIWLIISKYNIITVTEKKFPLQLNQQKIDLRITLHSLKNIKKNKKISFKKN